MDMVTSYSGRSRCPPMDAPRTARHVKAWENLQAGRLSNDPIRAASLWPYAIPGSGSPNPVIPGLLAS